MSRDAGRDARRGARRRAVPVASTAWLAALSLAAAGCPEPPPPAPAPPSVFGVQLHTHGSMSEGPASMRAHAIAAGALDGAVDVIWWTDHDWRIAGHTYVDGFDFEHGLAEQEPVPAALRMAQLDGREPLPDWADSTEVGSRAPPGSLESVRKRFVMRASPRKETTLRLGTSEREARTGRKSLHVAMAGTSDRPDRLSLGFEATRRRHIASLASDVWLGLSILPVAIEGDARLVLSVGLSQRRPGERARIEYVLAPSRALEGAAGPPPVAGVEVRERPGGARERVATIPVSTEPGVWNDWALPLSGDAGRFDLGGRDNSLVDLAIEIEVAPGARFEAWIDALTIERARLGDRLFDTERTMARELSDAEITHHVGQEISYAAHLNAYGAAVPLVDAARHPHGLSPEEAVRFVHRHGGLISLAHFFGTEFSMISHRFPRSQEAFDASLARLIERRAYGVDLLEVGYRSRGHGLDAFVELWDGLSAAGIRVVGVGVSDSHDAEVGWTEGPNNFITWIHADSTAEADLLAGLGAGRAFFGDPTRFDGVLDITTDSGGRMGDVHAVAPGPVRVVFHADGLREGQSLRVVRDGEAVAEHAPDGASARLERVVDVGAPTFLRLEVVEDERPVVLSNPIHLVPEEAG